MLAINEALREFGLITRGGFNAEGVGLPPLSDGRNALSIVLIGVAGSSVWPAFRASPEFSDGIDDPLDRWSARIGAAVANRFGATCVFPFDGPPYHPFLSWAERAEPVQPSFFGMYMHPDYGLWHAYRFALLFADPLPATAVRNPPADICGACVSKPCLHTCPVDAVAPGRYDAERCYRYLQATTDAACNVMGCIARRSCPEASDYRYDAEHAAFHMAAFRRAQARALGDN